VYRFYLIFPLLSFAIGCTAAGPTHKKPMVKQVEEDNNDDMDEKFSRKARGEDWNWPDSHQSPLSCDFINLGEYDVSIERLKNSQQRQFYVRQAGRLVLSFKCHVSTPFTRIGDTLFVADYSPLSSGCSIEAYDLSTGKKLWRHKLKGLGPMFHSKYWNYVVMDKVGDVIKVRGDEAAGRYVEYVDCKLGKTIAHNKRMKKDEEQ